MAGLHLLVRIVSHRFASRRFGEPGQPAIRDADLASASLQLNDAKLGLDAAFSARAKIAQTSLFDYLG